MKRTKRVFAATLGSVLLLASFGYGSVDGKMYTGAFCTFGDGDNSGQDRWAPKFKNASGSEQAVVCPVIQDIIGGNISYAEIVAHATMDEDTCRVAEREPDGTWGTWIHDDVVSTGGGFNRTRFFVTSADGDVASNASLAIKCDLPNGDFILSYRLDDST